MPEAWGGMPHHDELSQHTTFLLPVRKTPINISAPFLPPLPKKDSWFYLDLTPITLLMKNFAGCFANSTRTGWLPSEAPGSAILHAPPPAPYNT